MRHAELFIFPGFDGDGIVKPAPETAIACFLFVRLRHFKVLERHDAGNAAAVAQRLLMHSVVNKKRFIVVTLTKMMPQNRQYPVFGFDLRAKHSVEF